MTKVEWPADEALKRLIEAELTFKEIYGAQGLRTFLLQELTREVCLGEVAERNRRLIVAQTSAAEQNAARQLRIALKALEFYAARDNYQRDSSKHPSPVAADKGRKAREAIEAIDQDAPDLADAAEHE